MGKRKVLFVGGGALDAPKRSVKTKHNIFINKHCFYNVGRGFYSRRYKTKKKRQDLR